MKRFFERHATIRTVVATATMWLMFGVTAVASPIIEEDKSTGLHHVLKEKFIEGDASFMSLVALALVLGLAFCIERIIYLSLSEINAKKFMRETHAARWRQYAIRDYCAPTHQ